MSEYRLLNEGEKIEQGDEVLAFRDTMTWEKLVTLFGMVYDPQNMNPMRRKISNTPYDDLYDFLVKDLHSYRKAGNKLAQAALQVCDEYDGIHRLMLAVSEWSKVVANEGGRDKIRMPDGMVKTKS